MLNSKIDVRKLLTDNNQFICNYNQSENIHFSTVLAFNVESAASLDTKLVQRQQHNSQRLTDTTTVSITSYIDVSEDKQNDGRVPIVHIRHGIV